MFVKFCGFTSLHIISLPSEKNHESILQYSLQAATLDKIGMQFMMMRANKTKFFSKTRYHKASLKFEDQRGTSFFLEKVEVVECS